MLVSRLGRVSAVLVLLVVLGGLCVGFGIPNSVGTNPASADADDLALDYGSHVGSVAHVGGTVVETSPVVIEADYDYVAGGTRHEGTLRLTIHDVSRSVTVGQTLRTYALVQPDQELTARETVVVPRWQFWYMYAVSALAGVWTLARLHRTWTLDPSTFSLTRRDGGEL